MVITLRNQQIQCNSYGNHSDNIEKIIPKFMWNHKGPHLAKENLSKTKAGGIKHPDYNLHC